MVLTWWPWPLILVAGANIVIAAILKLMPTAIFMPAWRTQIFNKLYPALMANDSPLLTLLKIFCRILFKALIAWLSSVCPRFENSPERILAQSFHLIISSIQKNIYEPKRQFIGEQFLRHRNKALSSQSARFLSNLEWNSMDSYTRDEYEEYFKRKATETKLP